MKTSFRPDDGRYLAPLAIFWDGAERHALSREPATILTRMMSTVTAVEAGTVMLGRNGWRSVAELKALIVVLDIILVAFDVGHARFAADTFRLFGRGGHPTSLNLSDYFSHGLAKATTDPALFKGEDFARTNITRAVCP